MRLPSALITYLTRETPKRDQKGTYGRPGYY